MSIIAEDCTWNSEQVLLPQTLGRSLYCQPEVLPTAAERAYSSNSTFWADVLDDRTAIAERLVYLRNFNIFEWIPRNPGLYHTRDAAWAREHAMEHILTVPDPTRGVPSWTGVPVDHAISDFRSATAV